LSKPDYKPAYYTNTVHPPDLIVFIIAEDSYKNVLTTKIIEYKEKNDKNTFFAFLEKNLISKITKIKTTIIDKSAALDEVKTDKCIATTKIAHKKM